jgi:hypothetical protein
MGRPGVAISRNQIPSPLELNASVFHGSFLRSAQIFAQNCAIRRNVAQIHSPRFHSEKQAAQHREKLRKNSLGNYDTLSLFILSVLWRASVSTHPFYARISLGPKAEAIRQLLLAGRAPDPKEYSIVVGATLDHNYRATMLAPDSCKAGDANACRIYFPNTSFLSVLTNETSLSH